MVIAREHRAKLLGALVAVPLATFVLVYGHEWAHALGFWLSGYRPCIGLNNAWPADDPKVKTLVAGLSGPLFSLAVGTAFMLLHFYVNRFRYGTYMLSMVNFTAHYFFVLCLLLNLLVSGLPPYYDDETMMALMLPHTSTTTAEIEVLHIQLDRAFLFTHWQSLVIWILALVPITLCAVTIWKGKPLGTRRSVLFGALVWALCVAYTQAHIWLARHFQPICF